jgi:hypothetical protein
MEQKISNGDRADAASGTGTIGVIVGCKEQLYALAAGHVVNGEPKLLHVSSRSIGRQMPAVVFIRPSTASVDVEKEVAILQLDPRRHDMVESNRGILDMYSYERRGHPALFTVASDLDSEYARMRTPYLHHQIKNSLLFDSGSCLEEGAKHARCGE